MNVNIDRYNHRIYQNHIYIYIYIYLFVPNINQYMYHVVVHIMPFVLWRPWSGALIAARSHRDMRRLCHVESHVVAEGASKLYSESVAESSIRSTENITNSVNAYIYIYKQNNPEPWLERFCVSSWILILCKKNIF